MATAGATLRRKVGPLGPNGWDPGAACRGAEGAGAGTLVLEKARASVGRDSEAHRSSGGTHRSSGERHAPCEQRRQERGHLSLERSLEVCQVSERLRIVGVEEHVALPVLLEAWARASVPQLPQFGYGAEPFAQRLRDTGHRRLADMDDQGVDVAVLSLASPGVQNLGAAEAVSVAREANDALAEIVAAHPERFQALAAIPTPSPEAAATELERAITRLGFRGAMLH